MTYFYYRSTTGTSEPKISEKQIAEWQHLAEKKNWRIVIWSEKSSFLS